jgi:hypothetical protein
MNVKKLTDENIIKHFEKKSNKKVEKDIKIKNNAK